MLVGTGNIYLCALTVLSAVLPEPLDIQNFFTQVECGEQCCSSPEVISILPISLVAGGVMPEVFVRLLIRPKPCIEPSQGYWNVEFETAFPLADIFRRVEPGDSEQVELGLVPTGSNAGLAAIHRYCSSVSSDGVGADRGAARILLHCAVSGRHHGRDDKETTTTASSPTRRPPMTIWVDHPNAAVFPFEGPLITPHASERGNMLGVASTTSVIHHPRAPEESSDPDMSRLSAEHCHRNHVEWDARNGFGNGISKEALDNAASGAARIAA